MLKNLEKLESTCREATLTPLLKLKILLVDLARQAKQKVKKTLSV